MLLKNALKYSNKVRRREWEQCRYMCVEKRDGEDCAVDECGFLYVYENDTNDDWEPVPLPGDITILCRECGEEFYIEEQDCEGYNWTIKPQSNISLGIECPNCNTCY